MSKRRKGRPSPRLAPPAIPEIYRQPPFPYPRATEAVGFQEELFPAHIELLASRFSGPLPPPDLLREYDAVLPRLAQRIVDMADEEGKHRRALEKGLLQLSFLGWGSGTFVVLVTIFGGIFLLHQGRNIGGLSALIGALVALVVVFVGKSTHPPADTVPDEGAELEGTGRGGEKKAA